MQKLDLEAKTALVVVAHPDDETIWMGGTILANPGIKWLIVCLCRGKDLDRAPKFKKAARMLKARALIFNLEDEGLLNIRESVPEIKKIIALALRKKKIKRFGCVFTHGSEGEYGHPRHKAVHEAVKEMLRKRALRTGQVFFFSYRPLYKKKICVAAKGTTHELKLSPAIYKKKKFFVEGVYGFDSKSFESRSSLPKEFFRAIHNINPHT